MDRAQFELVLLRSAWDYSQRLAEFLDWAARVSGQTTLLNPLPVLRWNTDKHYLLDLAKAGVATVPSRFVEPGEEAAAALDAFLRDVRAILRRGDALLLGADLEKPLPQMLRAYDDPTGVTAAFNLNLLARINRELGADFELSHFAHKARYNRRERSVEMHLRSIRRQRVSIPEAHFCCEFAAGETIWTEACHKFRADEVAGWGRPSGFTCAAQWTDS